MRPQIRTANAFVSVLQAVGGTGMKGTIQSSITLLASIGRLHMFNRDFTLARLLYIINVALLLDQMSKQSTN